MLPREGVKSGFDIVKFIRLKQKFRLTEHHTLQEQKKPEKHNYEPGDKKKSNISGVNFSGESV